MKRKMTMSEENANKAAVAGQSETVSRHGRSVLALNAGSSGLKFALLETDDGHRRVLAGTVVIGRLSQLHVKRAERDWRIYG
jgi:hypothetical protein